MNFKELCYWNNNTYEPNYWKTISKKSIIAALLFIIALPIGTLWLGLPPVFKFTLKIIEYFAYTMGWKII